MEIRRKLCEVVEEYAWQVRNAESAANGEPPPIDTVTPEKTSPGSNGAAGEHRSEPLSVRGAP
jgi:hypothetical protein